MSTTSRPRRSIAASRSAASSTGASAEGSSTSRATSAAPYRANVPLLDAMKRVLSARASDRASDGARTSASARPSAVTATTTRRGVEGGDGDRSPTAAHTAATSDSAASPWWNAGYSRGKTSRSATTSASETPRHAADDESGRLSACRATSGCATNTTSAATTATPSTHAPRTSGSAK